MKWRGVSSCPWTLVGSLFVLVECIIMTTSAPQYDQSFIRTNASRKVPVPQQQPKPSNDNNTSSQQHAHHERHTIRETLVHTTTGSVRGLRRNFLNKEVYVYYGMPFAVPPVGELRFKKPVPIKTWPGRLDAIHLPNSCMQERYESFPGFDGGKSSTVERCWFSHEFSFLQNVFLPRRKLENILYVYTLICYLTLEEMWNPNTNISEDCLYLNLWVPKTGMTKMKQHQKAHNNLNTFKGLPILIWIYGI